MTKPRRASGQRGAMMVALMAGIAIMMIFSGIAAQKWADVIRRDNEAEMMFRAQDLVRALKRFQKDKGKLPNEMKELLEPGQKGQYFARRLWKDPLVRGGKWQLLYQSPGGGLLDPTTPAMNASPEVGQESPGPNGNVPVGIPDIVTKDDGSSEVSGLPIAGVKSRCTDRPFRVYRDKSEYNEWAFSVFDLDRLGGAAGQPAGQNRQNRAPNSSTPSFPPR